MRVSVHLIVVALLLGFGVLSGWAYLYTPSMIAAGCFQLAHRNAVVIWSEKYRVNFKTAPLR